MCKPILYNKLFLLGDNASNTIRIDKLKEILEKLEKNYNFAKVTEEDLNEKLNYITNIKQKLTPILYSKIRMLVLSGKK